jgi:glycosyltransferase involved in cell wall biosynthesis
MTFKDYIKCKLLNTSFVNLCDVNKLINGKYFLSFSGEILYIKLTSFIILLKQVLKEENKFYKDIILCWNNILKLKNKYNYNDFNDIIKDLFENISFDNNIVDEKKISIIMSVYNRDIFLESAINSLLIQNYHNYEIIVVIEKSSIENKVKKELLKYNDSRIVIINNQKKLGFAKSLNKAILKSTGDYITRLDDDDIASVNKLKLLNKYLNKNPSISIVGSYLKTFGIKSEIWTLPLVNDELKVRILFETPLYHPTVCFVKSNLLKNKLLYRNNYVTEDYDLWSRAINVLKIANIPEDTIFYRISKENATINNLDEINEAHHKIMNYMFNKFFHIKFTVEELIVLREIYNGWQISKPDIVYDVTSKLLKNNKIYSYCNQNELIKVLKIKNGIRFSIIIPILNVENYITKCLDSVKNQTFSDFECLLICDKSSDKSEEIAKRFAKDDKRFRLFHEENTGLSIARNIGVKQSKGEYILFLDADDYFELNLLEVLNDATKNEDLIRFQVREMFSDHSNDWNQESCEESGIECFNKIVSFHYVENAWSYCYNAKFYKKNHFEFMEHCIAEDYGLIPLIIAKAEKVKVISFIGYNYVQRNNSMMSNKDYNKRLIKMNDMIKQADNLYECFEDIKDKNIFMLFINNSLIYYSTTLKYNDYKQIHKRLIKMHAFDYLPVDSFKHKIKKMMIKTNSYLFYHLLVR